MGDRRHGDDLVIVALLTALAVMSVFAAAGPALRMLFGLTLLFCLPGYAILRASMREPPAGLSGAAFAAGLSIAITILCGFALHFAGQLTPEGWVCALGLVTLLACIVAHARGRSPASQRRRRTHYPVPTAIQATMMACAVLIAIGTVALARKWATDHPQFAYTELWMVPYVQNGNAFTIGVRNVERTPASYDLELLLDDRTVAVRRSIQLDVGETWQSDFSLPMRRDAARAAEARLFRSGDSTVAYRRVWLKTVPQS